MTRFAFVQATLLAAAVVISGTGMAAALAPSQGRAAEAPAPAAEPAPERDEEDRMDRMAQECRDAGGTHLSRGECMGQ